MLFPVHREVFGPHRRGRPKRYPPGSFAMFKPLRVHYCLPGTTRPVLQACRAPWYARPSLVTSARADVTCLRCRKALQTSHDPDPAPAWAGVP